MKKEKKYKNKIIISLFGIQYSICYYDENGKLTDIMCGCGGSSYFCQPCIKLLVHEKKYHNRKDIILEYENSKL